MEDNVNNVKKDFKKEFNKDLQSRRFDRDEEGERKERRPRFDSDRRNNKSFNRGHRNDSHRNDDHQADKDGFKKERKFNRFDKRRNHDDNKEREFKNDFVKKASLGEISNFEVNRITDLGYMLVDEGNYGKEDLREDQEYFLHNNESLHQELHEGDKVRAFLYVDKQKRVAATLMKPFITTLKGGLCEIVTVNNTGAYVNIGISKDILFSSDEYTVEDMPMIKNDAKTKIPCKIRLRGNTLLIKLLSKNDMIPMKDGTILNKGDEVISYVYRITGEGINLVDEHFNVIFVHKSNLRKSYHLGEEVKCVIIGSTEEDYYGSTILSKESFIHDDATIILNYLKEHHGVMNYASNTDPDIILRIFNMSKSSFKKALGNLYKDRKVILEENRTILVKNAEEK